VKLPPFLTEVEPNEIRVTGHRIGLYTLIRYHRERGWGEERLAEEFPTLTREEVRNVLAFYAENRAEVDAYMAWYKEQLDRQERELGPIGWEEVRRRAIAKGIDVDALTRRLEEQYGDEVL
jgi:uncharacterized protein (DUF433 family)